MSNGDDIELGRIEHVDPREIWESEPARFTPWLATHLGLLGEARCLPEYMVAFPLSHHAAS